MYCRTDIDNILHDTYKMIGMYLTDIRKKYPDKFFNYYRMSISSFAELLKKVRHHLVKQNTTFQNSISTEKR